jgi:uncharacterized protein
MPYVSYLLKPMVKDLDVSLSILQKDYALSFLLASMAETPGLGDRIALKGGTALKKLFYPHYRFTDEVAFSTLEPGLLPDGDELMQTAIGRMAALVEKRGPFEIIVDPQASNSPDAGQLLSYLVQVHFPNQAKGLCRLKVEIAVDEPLLLPVAMLPIRHEFSEPFGGEVQGYALAEIVAEKLRALLQSQGELANQGRGASQICQDYYDLWYILSRERLAGIPDLVARKCAARGIAFPSPDVFANLDLMRTAQREWNIQLSPFLPHPPLAEKVLAEVRTMIFTLFEAG